MVAGLTLSFWAEIARERPSEHDTHRPGALTRWHGGLKRIIQAKGIKKVRVQSAGFMGFRDASSWGRVHPAPSPEVPDLSTLLQEGAGTPFTPWRAASGAWQRAPAPLSTLSAPASAFRISSPS